MMKTTNVFYLMGADGIYIIDPVAKKLVNKITNTSSPGLCTRGGRRAPRRQCLLRRARVVGDSVFVVDSPGSAVHVIDIHTQKKIETIPTDPRPFGLHFLPWRKEVWVHSWTNSTFDVIRTEELTRTHRAIRAHIKPGRTHGIMVAHKEMLQGRSGYVTHTSNPGIHKINLETKSYSSFLNFTNQGCAGTFQIAYNSYNKHLYVDCRKARRRIISLLEVDVATDKIVKTWNISGTPFMSPNGHFVVVLSSPWGLTSVMNVLSVSESKSELYPEISIPGGVSHAVFYLKGNNPASYYVFVTLGRSNKMAVVDLDLAKSGSSSAVRYIEGVGELDNSTYRASRDLFINEKWIISPATASKTAVIINAETQKVHGIVNNVNGGRFAVWVGEVPSSATSGVGDPSVLMSFLVFFYVLLHL